MWTDYLAWHWKGDAIRLGYVLLGKGPTLLLLPALSSISTRHEMHPLQERLASAFSTITIDWPGFGDQPRPALAWEPAAYVAFLRHVITQLHLRPFATIAAGMPQPTHCRLRPTRPAPLEDSALLRLRGAGRCRP